MPKKKANQWDLKKLKQSQKRHVREEPPPESESEQESTQSEESSTQSKSKSPSTERSQASSGSEESEDLSNVQTEPIVFKGKWTQRVKCDVCGKEYSRSSKTSHCRTQFHLLHKEMNDLNQDNE